MHVGLFPTGTDSSWRVPLWPPMLAVRARGQYFVGPDNGILE